MRGDFDHYVPNVINIYHGADIDLWEALGVVVHEGTHYLQNKIGRMDPFRPDRGLEHGAHRAQGLVDPRTIGAPYRIDSKGMPQGLSDWSLNRFLERHSSYKNLHPDINAHLYKYDAGIDGPIHPS